jgi:dipeptidyl aminopeptidase/acylaminoacyl peptidase
MNAELRRKLFNLDKVENIRTPILIIRGEEGDPTRPETELLVEELTKHRKLFQYNTYPEEAYYVFRTKNRQQMLLDKLKFYDKYLKR